MSLREQLRIGSGLFANVMFAKAATWTDTVDQDLGEKIVHLGNSATQMEVEPEKLAVGAIKNLEALNRVLVFAFTDHATPSELKFKVQFTRKTAAGYVTPHADLAAITPGLDALNDSMSVTESENPMDWDYLTVVANSVDVDDLLFCKCTVSPTATTAAGVLIAIAVMLVPTIITPSHDSTIGNVFSAAGF